ncbi:MAG: ribosomal-processing cysteine protease Prp [Lachnospiraceae bacterium]|nr:ribosomal-processing cysteine protease Prp [Lachnospiraceae bacterium]
MITVTILKKNDLIVGAQVEGHAEFAKKGKDIVCSAVSMLYINLVNSLESFTQDGKEVNGSRKINFENVILKNMPSDEAELLLRSFHLGITTIEQKYGKRYIEILEQDV